MPFRARLSEASRRALSIALLSGLCAVIVALAAIQQLREQARFDIEQMGEALAQRLATEASPTPGDRLRLQALVNSYRELTPVAGAAILDQQQRPLAQAGAGADSEWLDFAAPVHQQGNLAGHAVIYLQSNVIAGSGSLILLALLLSGFSFVAWRALAPPPNAPEEVPGSAVLMRVGKNDDPALQSRLTEVCELYGGVPTASGSPVTGARFDGWGEASDHGFRALCCAELLRQISQQPVSIALFREDEEPPRGNGIRLSSSLRLDPAVGGRCQLQQNSVSSLCAPYSTLLLRQRQALAQPAEQS